MAKGIKLSKLLGVFEIQKLQSHCTEKVIQYCKYFMQCLRLVTTLKMPYV